MKEKILFFAVMLSGILLLSSCNSQEKKEGKTDVTSDTSTTNRTDTGSTRNDVPPNPQPQPVDNIYLVSLTPQFSIEGQDGKNWRTQITFNVIYQGQNIANFDSPDLACCSSGRPGGSPNPTDWNSGDVIPRGIKTLPAYKLIRADITKEMLSNSFAYLNWRPKDERDASDGIRWTLTAKFNDNSQVVYSRVETFANQSEAQAKRQLLKENIQ